MNTVLWIIQIILSIKLLSTAYTHGLRQDQEKMQQATQKMGAAARPLLVLAALGSTLIAAGLILPEALGFLSWLTPFMAAFLAIMLLAAILFHLKSREKPLIFADLILFALAVFVAYGRWVLAPL